LFLILWVLFSQNIYICSLLKFDIFIGVWAFAQHGVASGWCC
jgi:hypothetical protein